MPTVECERVLSASIFKST